MIVELSIAARDADRREMRAVLDKLRGVSTPRDFLAARLIVLVDVPGVPVARLVLRIDPELIAAARRAPRVRCLLDEAGDRAVVADLGAQILVLQPPRARLQTRRGLAAARVDDANRQAAGSFRRWRSLRRRRAAASAAVRRATD